MCKPASLVLTKTDAYWSDSTDSHEEIIAEHKIRERTGENVNILRVEIAPEDGDLFSDPKTWKYRVDQDELPRWHEAKKDERRARAALKDWVRARVFIGAEGLVFDANKVVFVKDCKIEKLTGQAEVRVMRGNSQVREMWENSQVGEMWESSQVREMRESSQVGEMLGSSQVGVMWENSQVREMRESSQVGEMLGSSQVGVMRENSQVREMRESSQVREMRGSSQVGVMWGSSQVGVMRESSQVGVMRGSSQVGVMWGSSQVGVMRGSSQVGVMRGSSVLRFKGAKDFDPAKIKSPFAVVIDCRGDLAICITAK